MQKTKLLQLTFIALAESFSLKDHEEAQALLVKKFSIEPRYLEKKSRTGFKIQPSGYQPETNYILPDVILKQANTRPDGITSNFENELITDDMRLPKNIKHTQGERPPRDILFVDGDEKNKYLFWNTTQIEGDFSSFEFQKQEIREVEGKRRKICLELQAVFLSEEFELSVYSFWANVNKDISPNRELGYDLMRIFPEDHVMCHENKRKQYFQSLCKNDQECIDKNERKIKKVLRCVPKAVISPKTRSWVKFLKLYAWTPSNSLTVSINATRGTVVGMDDFVFKECDKPQNNAANDREVVLNASRQPPTQPPTTQSTTTTRSATTRRTTTKKWTTTQKTVRPTKWTAMPKTAETPKTTSSSIYDKRKGESRWSTTASTTSTTTTTTTRTSTWTASTQGYRPENPDFVSWSSKAYKSATVDSYQGKIPSIKSLNKTPRVILPDPTYETSSESNSQIATTESVETKKKSKALAIWMVVIGIIVSLVCMLYCCYKFDIFNERAK